MKNFLRFASSQALIFLAGIILIAPTCAIAQSAGTGTVEGRIFNPETGEYLEFVRVTVEGTSLEAFTDTSGQYRLVTVPVGVVQVKAFRTGALIQTETVNVTAGRTAQQNFNLTNSRPEPTDSTVRLDQYVVKSSKEMDGAAVAINTQRFAANTMNVVAANEFGPVADGGVGEVLKSVPGINLARGGFGDAYLISLNGAPPKNVPVTIDGVGLANSASGVGRGTGMQQVSINNFSRIEVVYTPTPETSGAALAGTVNLVPLSAFERSKPTFNLTATIMMRDNARDFNKTPGPQNIPSRKVQPGSDFSAIIPINDRFGFTVSTSFSALYTGVEFAQPTWVGTSAASNGTTLPDTTVGNPYMSQFRFQDRPILSKRITAGGTVDYKISRNDRVSLSVQYGWSDAQAYQRIIAWNITGVAPGNFSTSFTHGNPGAGTIQMLTNYTKLGGPVITPSFRYRHDGPIWKAEAVAGLSRSGRYNQNVDKGMFSAVQAQKTGVTINFDNNYYLRPGKITVTDPTTGAAIDPFNINNYTLNNATGVLLTAETYKRTLYGNLQRDLETAIPITVKIGFDLRDERFGTRTVNPTYAYVGADRVANTADDNAAIAKDPSFSQRIAPFGFGRTDAISNQTLYSLYQNNPSIFTVNEATAHTATVANSKYAAELVSAAYFRGDVQFFDRRLKLVGGLRAEQTNAEGQGPLIDATRNYQRDAAGKIILDGAGKPVLISTDALTVARLTNVDRGLRAKKEYLRYFPSLNGTYNIRDNIIVRGGYYWSVGRPDYNQYAGGLTLPDLSVAPSATNRTTVNNIGVKAWTAKTFKLQLEYYFERVGLISVGAYTRTIKDFFGATVFTPTPDFLSLYGLDPNVYGSYDVATQYNLTAPVHMDGLDVNYKQALTFLPDWARGVQVFANATLTHLKGDDSGSLAGYVPQTYNWGISLSRRKFNVRMNWNYSGRTRQSISATGRSIEANTYTFASKRMIVDLNGEYIFTKHLSLFMNLSNIGDAPIDLEIAGPSTPAVAQFRSRNDFSAQWTFGVKGTF